MIKVPNWLYEYLKNNADKGFYNFRCRIDFNSRGDLECFFNPISDFKPMNDQDVSDELVIVPEKPLLIK